MSSLELKNVTVRAGSTTLLDDVTLSVAPGEFVALLGPNGAGKTSLIRTALGLLSPQSGAATLGGKPARALSGRERASLAAWLPQQGGFLEDLTALELAAAARFRFSETRRATLDASMEALRRAGAAEFASRIVTRLSGGEQQRVALACLLAQEAPLILLDEPANHLDPAQQISLYALIGDLWREGKGVLCITHDVNLLAHAARKDPARLRVHGIAIGRMAFASRLDAADLGARLSALFGIAMEPVEHYGRRVFLAGAAP